VVGVRTAGGGVGRPPPIVKWAVNQSGGARYTASPGPRGNGRWLPVGRPRDPRDAPDSAVRHWTGGDATGRLGSALRRLVAGYGQEPRVEHRLVGHGVGGQHQQFLRGQRVPNAERARHVDLFVIVMTAVRHPLGRYELEHVDHHAPRQQHRQP